MKKWKVLVALAILVSIAVILLLVRVKGERKLTLSDFEFLEPGIGLDQIIARVGEPDRYIGSGFYMPEYDLVDGGVVGLQFGADPHHLLVAAYQSADGTTTVLVKMED
jgi:hypothetical protein